MPRSLIASRCCSVQAKTMWPVTPARSHLSMHLGRSSTTPAEPPTSCAGSPEILSVEVNKVCGHTFLSDSSSRSEWGQPYRGSTRPARSSDPRSCMRLLGSSQLSVSCIETTVWSMGREYFPRVGLSTQEHQRRCQTPRTTATARTGGYGQSMQRSGLTVTKDSERSWYLIENSRSSDWERLRKVDGPICTRTFDESLKLFQQPDRSRR